MTEKRQRLFYFMLDDWTWWVWSFTALLLAVGIFGQPEAFTVAIVVTILQTLVVLIRQRGVFTFALKLRLAYLALLLIFFIPAMRWLYWWPMLGTFALVIFGYCLLARVLFLFPWNREEKLSFDLLRRTFFSSPNLSRVKPSQNDSACGSGLCTIEAQIVGS